MNEVKVGGNKMKVIKSLDIERQTLYNKIKEYKTSSYRK
ncbi:helix-turn-helix domain-containing protein [Clostridium sp.]